MRFYEDAPRHTVAVAQPVTPKPGMHFQHARYIQGSPRAGTARPDVCRVTKVTRTTVYYRTETNMLISTGLDKFAASVLAWVES